MKHCCTASVASWETVQTAHALVYRGQIRTQCRVMQVWKCEHNHRSRETATICAEKELTKLQKQV